MHRSLIILLVAVAAIATTASVGAAPQEAPTLTPYTATYSVSRGRMRIGEMRVQLTHTETGSWLLQSHSRTTGVIGFLRNYQINETTRFRIRHDTVVPFQHVYTLTGDRRDRNFALVFDWVRSEIRGIVAGEEVSAEIEPGMVDRHTVLLDTVLAVRAARETPYRLVTVDRARIRELEVRHDGVDTLQVPGGTFRTLRIVQQRVDDPNKRVVLWLAADDRELPVRVRSVDDDGQTITLELLDHAFH